MLIVKSKFLIRIMTVVTFVFGLYFNQAVLANEHETVCKAHIQDKIPWKNDSSYDSASKWEDTNLEALCKGTKNPKEPGECFHKVMTGHVKWGDSDKWEFKNAIGLCAGTDNSDERIACFKGRISAGEKWDAAILQCQSSGKIVIQ